jgi:hypothetical protein
MDQVVDLGSQWGQYEYVGLAAWPWAPGFCRRGGGCHALLPSQRRVAGVTAAVAACAPEPAPHGAGCAAVGIPSRAR